MKTRHFILFAILIFTLNVFSQQSEFFKVEKSNLIVKGTSSLHDWEMVAENVNCSANILVINEKVEKIEKVDFICKAKSLKSEHSLMDTKAWDALKTSKYPEIKFSLTSSNITTTSTGEIKGNIEGTLLLSGVNKKVTIPISGKLNSLNNFEVKGAIKLNMTDFNMEPPTAMFGTITTGNQVEVVYDITLRNSGSTAMNLNK